MGDEGGAKRDDFRRETIRWSKVVPQASHPVQNLFESFLQGVDLQVMLSATIRMWFGGPYFSCQCGWRTPYCRLYFCAFEGQFLV